MKKTLVPCLIVSAFVLPVIFVFAGIGTLTATFSLGPNNDQSSAKSSSVRPGNTYTVTETVTNDSAYPFKVQWGQTIHGPILAANSNRANSWQTNINPPQSNGTKITFTHSPQPPAVMDPNLGGTYPAEQWRNPTGGAVGLVPGDFYDLAIYADMDGVGVCGSAFEWEKGTPDMVYFSMGVTNTSSQLAYVSWGPVSGFLSPGQSTGITYQRAILGDEDILVNEIGGTCGFFQLGGGSSFPANYFLPEE